MRTLNDEEILALKASERLLRRTIESALLSVTTDYVRWERDIGDVKIRLLKLERFSVLTVHKGVDCVATRTFGDIETAFHYIREIGLMKGD